MKQYWAFILCGRRRYRLTTNGSQSANTLQAELEEANTSINADGVTYSIMDDIVAVEIRHGKFILPDKFVDVFDEDNIWDWFDESIPLSDDEYTDLMENREYGLNKIKNVAAELSTIQATYDGLLLDLEKGGWEF